MEKTVKEAAKIIEVIIMLIYLEDLYHHGFCSFHYANVEVMVLHVVTVYMLLSTSMPSKYVKKGIHRPQQCMHSPAVVTRAI